jgi:hypothetical protein
MGCAMGIETRFCHSHSRSPSCGTESIYSKLSESFRKQRIRVSAGGEGKGQCRTRFDVDSLEKLVTLAPLLALELFPSRPTRLGAFGTIQPEHVHAQIRLLARNDQRECSAARAMIRYLAEHLFVGAPAKLFPRRPTDRPGENRPAT